MLDYFVVGDVQGCFAELTELLGAAGFDGARHRLAFTGDLINRGPASRRVLELARRHDADCVVGNHEDALLAGARGGSLDRVRTELGAQLDDWLAWIRTWPTFRRYDGWILVHAGI